MKSVKRFLNRLGDDDPGLENLLNPGNGAQVKVPATGPVNTVRSGLREYDAELKLVEAILGSEVAPHFAGRVFGRILRLHGNEAAQGLEDPSSKSAFEKLVRTSAGALIAEEAERKRVVEGLCGTIERGFGFLTPLIAERLLAWPLENLQVMAEDWNEMEPALRSIVEKIKGEGLGLSVHTRQVRVSVVRNAESELSPQGDVDMLTVPEAVLVRSLAQNFPGLLKGAFGALYSEAVVKVGAVTLDGKLQSRDEVLADGDYLVDVWREEPSQETPGQTMDDSGEQGDSENSALDTKHGEGGMDGTPVEGSQMDQTSVVGSEESGTFAVEEGGAAPHSVPGGSAGGQARLREGKAYPGAKPRLDSRRLRGRGRGRGAGLSRGAGRGRGAGRQSAVSATAGKVNKDKPAKSDHKVARGKVSAWFSKGARDWAKPSQARDEEVSKASQEIQAMSLDAGEDSEEDMVKPDEEDPSAIFAVSSEPNTNCLLGIVMGVEARKASVIVGRNQLVHVWLPTKGANSLKKRGDTVALHRAIVQRQDGLVSVKYRLVSGVTKPPKFSLSDFPMLKGVVVRYDEDSRTGQLRAPLTGSLCDFCLEEEHKGHTFPGSVVMFYPKFHQGELTSYFIPLEGGVLTRVGKGAEGSVPATKLDLVEGFLRPGTRLQAIAKARLGVNATPFVGPDLSCFELGCSEPVIRELMKTHEVKKRDQLSLKLIEDTMVKARFHKETAKAVGDERLRAEIASAPDYPVKSLIVPTEGFSQAFTKWVKASMKSAAGAGRRLRLVVGVFVDEGCTAGSLYNTEDVPYFKFKAFPWVRSFTLMKAPMMCQEVHGSGMLVPSAATAAGKKILLVELDSYYQTNALPKVVAIGTTMPSDDLVVDRRPGYTVLVSLPKADVRRRILVQKYGAVTFKTRGSLETLAVTFDSQEEAEAFLQSRAKKPKGMYVMAKESLYHKDTLTLTVSDRKGAGQIIADELFYITRAAGVLPIGNNRFRICTRMAFLEVAQVLNFNNRYLQGDNNKYSVLRDDKDRYVQLDTASQPKSVLEYLRSEPPEEISLHEAEQQLYWFKMVNLPHGLDKEMILTLLENLKDWPGRRELVDVVIDSSKFLPTLTFSLKQELTSAHSFLLEGRIVAILPVEAPLEKPQDVESGSPELNASQPCADLDSVETGQAWAPRKAITSYVERKYKNKRRVAVRQIARRKAGAPHDPEDGGPLLASRGGVGGDRAAVPGPMVHQQAEIEAEPDGKRDREANMDIGEEVQKEAQPDRKGAEADGESEGGLSLPSKVSDEVAADQSAAEDLAGEMGGGPGEGSRDNGANLRNKKRRLDPARDDLVVVPIAQDGVAVPPGFFPVPMRPTRSVEAGGSPSLEEVADNRTKLENIRQSLAADFNAAFKQ